MCSTMGERERERERERKRERQGKRETERARESEREVLVKESRFALASFLLPRCVVSPAIVGVEKCHGYTCISGDLNILMTQ